jgi:hypothetical protein
MAILYIIGNGFDLHHGMATGYWHFGEYLKQSERELRGYLDEYLPVDDDDFWGQFEEQLASFDADTLIENSEQFIVPYSAEDWSDAYHHDYAYELERVVGGLSEGLLKAFTAWIRHIAVPLPGKLAAPKARIDLSARFITFNYTETLQRLYSVPEAQVWHIHGAAAGDGGLVLGHGWRPKPAETYSARLDPERDDTRVLEGAQIIDRYFKNTFKPTERIIAENASRFAAIADVDDIRVLGHSLSDVDLPYLRKIAASVGRGAQWRISYYDDPAPLQVQSDKVANLKDATFLPLASV